MKKEADSLVSAFSSAATKWRTMSGKRDQDMENYDKLTNDDFSNLHREFGVSATAEYIKEMEMKRQGFGG